VLLKNHQAFVAAVQHVHATHTFFFQIHLVKAGLSCTKCLISKNFQGATSLVAKCAKQPIGTYEFINRTISIKIIAGLSCTKSLISKNFQRATSSVQSAPSNRL